VYCPASLDTVGHNDLDSIYGGLERAAATGEIIHLYAHIPGVTVPTDKLEAVLTRAHDLGLTFVTYADLAAGTATGPGIALSFDDSGVDAWTGERPAFDAAGARVTFFVTRYPLWTDAMKTELHQLADDGHDIEAHTIGHRNAPDYVADRGLQAWLDDDALPSIDVLRADGYAPVAFAYPFGARTRETDRAMLGHVSVLRSVAFSLQSPVLADPCPQ